MNFMLYIYIYGAGQIFCGGNGGGGGGGGGDFLRLKH